VPIQKDGLHLGQQGEPADDVIPAGLHHADPWVGKVGDGLLEKSSWGYEVGIEHGQEITARSVEAGLQGAGLETLAIGLIAAGLAWLIGWSLQGLA